MRMRLQLSLNQKLLAETAGSIVQDLYDMIFLWLLNNNVPLHFDRKMEQLIT